MANTYEIIEFLCANAGIKPGKLCSEIGMSRGIISDLKAGRTKELSVSNMQKIANYFQVSTDIFNEGVFEETLPNNADMELIREIQNKFALKKEKSPSITGEGKHHIPDKETLKLLELLETREDIRYLAAASERATPEHVKATAKMFDELYGRNQDK